MCPNKNIQHLNKRLEKQQYKYFMWNFEFLEKKTGSVGLDLSFGCIYRLTVFKNFGTNSVPLVKRSTMLSMPDKKGRQ